MLENFIYAKQKSLFEEALNNGEILDEAIVFIEDTKEIWNHGTYFATQLSIDEIESIVASSETVQSVMEQIVLDTLDSLPVSIVSDGDGSKFLADDGSYKVVESKFIKFSSNNMLKFYCIEPVTITLNGEDTIYPANSSVSVTLMDSDEWTITPTSDNSITLLESWPGTLGTFYSWLEGVQVFSSIVFDMNDLAMYEKWNQGHQGEYHVQFAQYNDCIFWSDNAYVNAVAERTNYTLYYSSQLPLCYSSIPENTFKAFYMAYSVTSDPNWSNPLYKASFAQATWATQVFSYYGLHSIGMFDMDSPDFNITLPKDCRGLMFYAPNVLNAGVFDAVNVTNFGAKSGSWRDAFAYCYCLENLNIKNLKVNLNISWSPINQVSLNFILSNAANTNAITIYLSPVTYYALTDDNKNIAAEKNITLSLIDTNWDEDKRTKAIQLAGDGTKFLANDGSYKEITVPTKVSELENDANYFSNGKDIEDGVYIYTTDNKFIKPDDWNNNNYDKAVCIVVIYGEHCVGAVWEDYEFISEPTTYRGVPFGINGIDIDDGEFGYENTKKILEVDVNNSSAAYITTQFIFKNGEKGHLPSIAEGTLFSYSGPYYENIQNALNVLGKEGLLGEFWGSYVTPGWFSNCSTDTANYSHIFPDGSENELRETLKTDTTADIFGETMPLQAIPFLHIEKSIIQTQGDGTKFLSNDGSYKEVSSAVTVNLTDSSITEDKYNEIYEAINNSIPINVIIYNEAGGNFVGIKQADAAKDPGGGIHLYYTVCNQTDGTTNFCVATINSSDYSVNTRITPINNFGPYIWDEETSETKFNELKEAIIASRRIIIESLGSDLHVLYYDIDILILISRPIMSPPYVYNKICYIITETEVKIFNYGGSEIFYMSNGDMSTLSNILVTSAYKNFKTINKNTTFSLSEDAEIFVTEYQGEFSFGDTVYTVTFPEEIIWDVTPIYRPNKRYQFSIVNNLGVMREFPLSNS